MAKSRIPMGMGMGGANMNNMIKQAQKMQQDMLKMQEETKLIYTKYGTSPTGGCLGSLIQLPFL